MKERREKTLLKRPSDSFPAPRTGTGRAGCFRRSQSNEAHGETGETSREQPQARKPGLRHGETAGQGDTGSTAQVGPMALGGEGSWDQEGGVGRKAINSCRGGSNVSRLPDLGKGGRPWRWHGGEVIQG